MNGYTKAQVVGFFTLVFIILIILLVTLKFISYLNRPVEILQNENVLDDGFSLVINGNFVTYLNINELYKEKGCLALNDGEKVSYAVSYFKDDRQVSFIDSSETGNYLVKYEALDGSKLREVTRVVIVLDNKKPRLVMPDTVSISLDEVLDFDVEKDVLASDNSSKVSLKCENTLENKVGNYVIKCTAQDDSGNKTVKNRLIKVVP